MPLRGRAGNTSGMTRTKRITVATGCLALLLSAGCTSDADSPDTDVADGGATPTSAPTSASPTAAASTPPADAAASFATLTGEATRLSLDQSVVDTLGTLGVELTAVGGAQNETSGGAATFVFPVTGGQATVDPAASEPFTGTVQHEGGLRLSALGRNVTADGLVLDGQQGQLTAMVGGRRVPLLPLATDPEVSRSGEQVVLTYSAASLDTSAIESLAGELNLPSLPSLEVNSLESTLEGS